MKIYCAGKIRKGDWRQDLIGWNVVTNEHRDENDGICPTGLEDVRSYLPDTWPITDIDGVNSYTGPYFMRCDHGCFHGENSHGVAANELLEHRQKVVNLCQQAIEISDAVFVWMDRLKQKTAFGTLAEIGYASAFNKRIYIAGHSYDEDLWFVYQMAHKVMFSDLFDETWIPTILRELHLDLAKMPYRQYLQTEHWQKVREAVVKFWGDTCGLCNKKGQLHVHHRTYERRGCEQLYDLIALCSDCHAKFHDKIPRGAR